MTDADRLRDLVDLGLKMRAKQKEYFDTSRRTANTIHEAKYLEAAFDRLVAEIRDAEDRLF